MLQKKYLLMFLFILNLPAQAWLCPDNFNSIKLGDSLAQVRAQCGKPLSEKKSTIQPDVAQEWGYYVPVNPPNPATIKMTVVFSDKKVVSITSNAMSLVSSSVCGGTINVGDSEETVKAACGNPMFVNKGPAPPGQKETQVIEMLYPGLPPNTLVFENGILKQRK